MAGTVETMGADFAFRQADCFDQSLQRVKLERAESEPFGNDADQLLVFRRISLCIFVQVLVFVAFQFLDDPTGDQFERTLGRGEADEGAGVDQRWASDTHVYLFGSMII